MSKRLTFFESLFLNKQLKEKKLFEQDNSQSESVFFPEEFQNKNTESDLEQLPFEEDSLDFDEETSTFIEDSDTSDDLLPEFVETPKSDGLILLNKTYDESLYEEDDDDKDSIDNTKVFMTTLSKTLNFKSNINFDEDDNYDDSDFDDFSDLDLFDDLDLDLDLDDDIFDNDETLDNTISSDDDFISIDIETNSIETEKDDFSFGDGIMHFDLDDQLDINDIEGTTSNNLEEIDVVSDFDSEVSKFGFDEDYLEESTIEEESDSTETNFPVLGTIEVEDEKPANKTDDDEINIPML